MLKRRAEELSQDDDSTNRHRTRSSGLLSPQLALSPDKKRCKILPVVSTPKFSDGRGSSKENETKDVACNATETSDDELDLLRTSSSKTMAAPASPKQLTPATREATVSPRQVMEAVVITTPKSALRTPQSYIGRMTGSPSPTLARNTSKGSPAGPQRDNRKHLISQSPRNPFVSAPTSPASPILSPDASSKRIWTYPSRPASTKQFPRPLPSHLVPYLHLQKKAVLNALQCPPLNEHESSSYHMVFDRLMELVKGTTERHEGNSCLILGPKGSGKSRVVDSVLASVASTSSHAPAIVRLSAHCQTNDRLAMREIARQIQKQLGSSLLPTGDDEEDSSEVDSTSVDIDLPPSSQLPGMVAALPSLGLPVIVVLDGFDGFAAHSRQALLYCLLDTVQSCRGGTARSSQQPVNPSPDVAAEQDMEKNSSALQDCLVTASGEDDSVNTTTKREHGLLVIGVTTRVDCLTLLEKRVKSRFSHRIMRVGTPSHFHDILELLSSLLHVEADVESVTTQEWKQWWTFSVKDFLADREVLNTLKDTFAFSKDLRTFSRLLISPVATLTPNSPWLTASQFITSVSTQRSSTHFPFLPALPYPHVALLIAAAHEQTAGHDTFNFETLHDKFITQVRVSASAPVHVDRGGLGMVNVARGVLLGAFEQLVTNRVFQPVAAPSNHITKEFVKYRNTAPREDLKAAVERLGQTNLRKWFSRNQ